MMLLFHSTEPLSAAIAFAAQCHARQTDLGGEPYVFHVTRVAMAVGLDSSIPQESRTTAMVAAALHDVMEDCGVSYRRLRRLFGQDVAVLVLSLTRPKSKIILYEQYIAQVARVPIAARIKLADLADNMDSRRVWAARAAGANMATRLRRYREAMEALRASRENQVRNWGRAMWD